MRDSRLPRSERSDVANHPPLSLLPLIKTDGGPLGTLLGLADLLGGPARPSQPWIREQMLPLLTAIATAANPKLLSAGGFVPYYNYEGDLAIIGAVKTVTEGGLTVAP